MAAESSGNARSRGRGSLRQPSCTREIRSRIARGATAPSGEPAVTKHPAGRRRGRPGRHPGDPALFRHPFLVLAGDRAFNLPSEGDLGRLRRYLTYGGFLLIDSAEGRAGGGFDDSVRKMLAQLLPGELPARIPDSHVLWKSFYVRGGAPGRVMAAPYVEGVERDRCLAGVYSQHDLEGAWARDGFGHWEHEVIPGGDAQREEAFRFGVNLVMYALCLDYKPAQAHLDYILRTRQFPR